MSLGQKKDENSYTQKDNSSMSKNMALTTQITSSTNLSSGVPMNSYSKPSEKEVNKNKDSPSTLSEKSNQQYDKIV